MNPNYKPTHADLDRAWEIAVREFVDSNAPKCTKAERNFRYLVFEAYNASPTGTVFGDDHGTPLTIGEAQASLDRRWGSTYEKRPATTKLETR